MTSGWKALVVLATLLAAGSMLVSAALFRRLSDQQHSINQSRVNITYQNCREQNSRHDRTLAKLASLIAKLPPARHRRAQQNAGGSIALIETLAPHQNCLALVHNRFGPSSAPDRS